MIWILDIGFFLGGSFLSKAGGLKIIKPDWPVRQISYFQA